METEAQIELRRVRVWEEVEFRDGREGHTRGRSEKSTGRMVFNVRDRDSLRRGGVESRYPYSGRSPKGLSATRILPVYV